MCEATGVEPKEEDMPVDFGDLCYECRAAIEAYAFLPTIWAGEGHYMGKDYSNCGAVFNLLEIYDNRQEILQMLMVIDREVSADIARKQKVK